MVGQKEYSETLTIAYESNPQRADAKAVGSSLLAVQSLIGKVQSDFDENEKILVKARPFARGSLELPIDLIVFGAAIILQEYPLFSKIREVITQYFDIKGRLQGNPIHVEEGNVVIIKDSRIQVDRVTLQCLDPGSEVSQKCSEAFHAIEEDMEIKSVRISSSSDRKPLAEVQRAEFPYFHPETPISEQHLDQRRTESRETLIIRQPAFDADLAWRFIWGSTKISAKVLDKRFQNSVGAGHEAFASGDSLDVDLQRLQEYDPAALTYVDKHYTVSHVWKHNRGASEEQSEFFD